MAPVLGHVMLCAVVWIAVPQYVSTFLLDGPTECPAVTPCTCSQNYGRFDVTCTQKGLTAVPTFKPTNITVPSLGIIIYRNKVTKIPTDSFQNLTLSNDTGVILSFYMNNIYCIETHAFRGIAHNVVSIDLHYNNLSTVPAELVTLSNLIHLALAYNPILTLNANTMFYLGKTLTSFTIDLKYFNSWPSELNFLTSLYRVDLQYIPWSNLDFDVFDSFADSLDTLVIVYSSLTNVPAAICHLHKLKSLLFSANQNLHGNSSFIENCNRNFTNVTELHLQENGLRYMPNVFKSFPMLHVLLLSDNKLTYLPWDKIPDNSPLEHLYLHNNDFNGIPSAINKFRALVHLEMDSNKITSIEYMDFSQLSALKVLHLKDNPIEYISPIAFRNNLNLEEIHLQNTYVHKLPSSLADLHHLRDLYLEGSPVVCNCELSYLKPLNVSSIDMNGNCQIIPLTIKTFLATDLQMCH